MSDHEITVTIRAMRSDAGRLSGVTTKVLVDGEQVGFISTLDLHLTSESIIPKMRVAFLEGMSGDGLAECSEDIRRTVGAWTEKLQQLPFVEIVAPDFPESP